ncbi:hypothetical protein ES703_55829 [subsurface metagenome]
MVHKFIGVRIFLPGNVLNFPVFEFAKQVDALPEERSDLLAFYLVLAVNLFDEQFAVTENRQPFTCGRASANLLCGFEGFADGGVFGHVVGSSAQKECFGLQLCSGGVG